MVEYASTRLMSFCTIATVAASSAVIAPTHATTVPRVVGRVEERVRAAR